MVLFLPPLSLPQKNIFTATSISEGQQALRGSGPIPILLLLLPPPVSFLGFEVFPELHH